MVEKRGINGLNSKGISRIMVYLNWIMELGKELFTL